jgi:hypothetical protein
VLTKIEVTNSLGNVLTLPMDDDDSEYVVADIDGLDPVEATLISLSYAGQDGEVFQSAKRAARNIKIKVDLDPGTSTVTDLRQALYAYFLPKSQIKLRLYQDSGLYVDINGVVESMPTPLFVQQSQVNISVMCYMPDFTDPRTIDLAGVTVADSTNTAINYPGNVETDTVVTLNVNRALSAFTIYSSDQGGNLHQLDFAYALLSGDTLVVSSVRGAKRITLTRAGVSSSVLYGRPAQSSWIQLFKGINQFRIYAPGDPVPYVLEYSVRYGGL